MKIIMDLAYLNLLSILNFKQHQVIYSWISTGQFSHITMGYMDIYS